MIDNNKYKKLQPIVIKSLFTLVYNVSKGLYLLAFVFATLLGFYHYDQSNILIIFSKLLVILVFSASIIVVYLLFNKPSFYNISNMVGYSYINNKFPVSYLGLRGVAPFFIFGSILLLFFVVDFGTYEWLIYINNLEVSALKEKTKMLFEHSKQLDALKNSDKAIIQINKALQIEGIITKLINTEFITSFVNLFDIKK